MHFTSVSSLPTDGINTFLLKITFVNVETESNCVTMVLYMYLQWIGNNVETRDTFEIAFGTSKTVTTCETNTKTALIIDILYKFIFRALYGVIKINICFLISLPISAHFVDLVPIKIFI